MTERPEEDASAADIAEWMEEDFWKGVEDSIRNTVENADG